MWLGRKWRDWFIDILPYSATNNPYEKRGDNEPVCIADEVPFEIPESWEWCRFDNATLYSTDYVANGSFASLRDNVKTYKSPNYALMIKTADFANNFSCDLTYTDEAGYKYLSKSELYGGELMLSNIGASIGKAFIIPKLRIPMTLAPNSIVVKCYENTTLFFYYLIISFYGQNLLNDFTAGTAMPKFSKTQLRNALVPIPPLTEQLRIVSKIEELLPLISEYEKVETQLTALNTAFPDQLKKSILQQAIQGKLVPQNPDDEPASVLLERIRAEKQELIKAGKIKKDKNESVIFKRDNSHYELCGGVERCIDDEIPFDVPESWCWARCSSLGTMIRGNGIKRTETVSVGKPCIRYGEIYTTYNIKFKDSVSFITAELDEQCKHISKGDVLFTLTGENKPDIAKAIVYEGENTVAIGGDLAFWTYHGMNPLYLVYFMASPYAINRKVDLATGDIIVHISGEKVGSILIPIPPITEQKRIVSKIEELLPIIKKI